MEEKKGLIRSLNDSFRSTFIGGRALVTAGVANLAEEVQSRALSAVRGFSTLTEDSDPHGEHDFGAFSLAGYDFFWKIDYYDKNESGRSQDPADPERTARVLTIMLASEY